MKFHKHFNKLLVALFCLMGMNVYAAKRTFYFQATATAANEAGGTVYASFASTAPGDDAYVASFTTDVFSKSAGSNWSTPSNTTNTLYLYAKPAEGYKFKGWATAPDATEYVSTATTYKPTVTSKKYSSDADPEVFTYYAFFADENETYSSMVNAVSVGTGVVAVATASGNNDFGTSKSASSLAAESPAHTYYLQAKVESDAYRFVAWYTDEACTEELSKNANYTYKVTAESVDETAPTVFNVYAKFEAIPYYYSVVMAAANGIGKVNVSKSSTAGEYGATSEASNKVADKAEHTYYLNAENDESSEFDGWFTDAACTNLLSEASTYTYKVTSTSLDEADASTFNVYAKFTPRNMYQVRNGGFEKWAASNEVGFGWNSFQSASGSMASTGKGLSPNPAKVEGRSGYAVKLTSKYAGFLGIGANANGNLTTGTVNMGSMTPADASNHNYTDVKTPGHNLLIIGQPDAVEFYSKYKMGDGEAHTGHAQFILHDKINYIDPELEEQAGHRIGSSSINIEESTEWVRNYGEFTYDWDLDAAAASEKYLLINFTTNATPGGSKNDELILDDVRLIYNSELASATIDGTTLEFVDGAANCSDYYDEAALDLTSNGRAATIETAYNAETAVLTITVKGQDIEEDPSNMHVYTIQYKPMETASLVVTAANEYGTFVAPFDVEVPENVAAFTAEVNDVVIELTPVVGFIPANTPVILQALNGESTSVTVYGKDQLETPAKKGCLVGTYEAMAAPVGSYVLQNHDGVVGFYLVESTQPTVKANRAYLTAPAAGVKAFFFNNEDAATAIDKIAAENGNENVYDLNGRRVLNAQKGVFIVNGKKVIK